MSNELGLYRALNLNPAEYGRAAGAVISAVTKSGTNVFHGSGYAFVRNDRFDARNFFDGPQRPVFDLKQFGGSLSGPIRRDRAFFFNSYEGSRKNLGATASGTVPSAAFRASVASALAHSGRPYTVTLGAVTRSGTGWTLAPGSFGRFFNTFGRTEGFGTSRQTPFAVRYLFSKLDLLS